MLGLGASAAIPSLANPTKEE